MKKITLGLVSIFLFASTQGIATVPSKYGKKVNGYTVDICMPSEYQKEDVLGFDASLDRKNFCTKAESLKYAKYTIKDINFNGKYVLIRHQQKYLTALDPATKKVYVVPFVFESIRSKKSVGITFSRNSNRICTTTYPAIIEPFAGGAFGNSGTIELGEDNKYVAACIDFYNEDNDKGFGHIYPVDKRTGKEIFEY